MPISNVEIMPLLAFLVLGAGIVISICIEMFSKKSEEILPWFSILLFAFVGGYSLYNIDQQAVLFGNMVAVGGKPAIFNLIFAIGASLVTLNSVSYLKKYGTYYGEYYILIQSAVLGMMVMASAQDLFMVFLGLELMSICFYVLAGINRNKPSANEASMKYFLLGAFATGFIVYGIGFIYGTAETTNIISIVSRFSALSGNILFITGLTLLLIGFTFKIAAFPFHMWVPDVYQGSATTVTGFMSTTGKTAAFSIFIIILASIFAAKVENIFQDFFSIIAVLSMLYGSIVAIAQNNIKRMLAYSSISHAGYMVIGLAAGNVSSVAGIIFYLAAYTFMNVGAFAVISAVEGENDTNLDLDAYAGLNSKSPILAGFMALFMFALAGIPPMAGFFGKYYVFIAAIEADITWLAIIGVISSVISVYFYLRVVVYMYFKDAVKDFPVNVSATSLTAVVLAGLLVIVFGLLPDTLLNVIVSVLNY